MFGLTPAQLLCSIYTLESGSMHGVRYDQDPDAVFVVARQAVEHFVLHGWREPRKLRLSSAHDGCRIELFSSGKDATVDIRLDAASPSRASDMTD